MPSALPVTQSERPDLSKRFLVLACTFGICQSCIVIGLVSAVISTIERQYAISSSQSGVMFAVYDVCVAALIIPMSYLGARNTPKVLGCR
jgi:predicted MFS family arabinose efflux permease